MLHCATQTVKQGFIPKKFLRLNRKKLAALPGCDVDLIDSDGDDDDYYYDDYDDGDGDDDDDDNNPKRMS